MGTRESEEEEDRGHPKVFIRKASKEGKKQRITRGSTFKEHGRGKGRTREKWASVGQGCSEEQTRGE